MKILTWNINGIRAVQSDKTGLKKLLDSLDANVICLQETKVTRDMLDEPTAIVEDYDSYFGFSRKKTGYSGTANFCDSNSIPTNAEEGLTGRLSSETPSNVGHYAVINSFTSEELDALDDEGRCVITQHRIKLPEGDEKEVAIINVYVPRAGDREERFEYKLKFLTLLQLRAEALLRNGIHVIILGDINTTHKKIDNCDPRHNDNHINQTSRIWLNKILQVKERDPSIPKTDGFYADLPVYKEEGGQFSDVYRRLHPDDENAFTNWCTLTGARQTNYGRRLDYILVDKQLANYTKECKILADVQGSDHCPVVLTLNCTSISSSSSPALCSKFMPEFRGHQKKLSAFFSKVIPNSNENSINCEDKQINSGAIDGKNVGASLVNNNSSSSAPTLKRQASSNSQIQGKKAKLKKEGSKQVSLKFFFSSPKKQVEERSDSSGKHSNSTINVDNDNSIISSNNCIESLEEDKYSDVNKPSSLNNFKEVSASTSNTHQLPVSNSKVSVSKAWKNILGGLPPPPLCPGHNEPSVLRTVKKEGPNKNKQFYVCSKPDGAPGNPLSRCDFFQWLSKKKQ